MVGPSPPSSSATRLQTRGGLDRGPGAGRSGERNEVDARIAHQQWPDDIAVEDIDRARRRAGIDENPRDLVDDARTLRRRLENDGVACRQRRRDLVAGEIERRVEWGDTGDDADREAQQERKLAGAHRARVHRHLLAGDADRLLRRQLERVLRAHDLGARILDRLAGLSRHDLGNQLGTLDQQLAGAPQQVGALVARHRRHGLLGTQGRIKCGIEVLGA